MKRLIYFFVILLFFQNGFGQEIQDLKITKLDLDNRIRVIQHEEFEDYIKVKWKVYGPCKADLRMTVKELESDGISNVGLTVYDKANVYKRGKLKCGSYYLLEFKLLGFKVDDNFRGWAMSNKTVPRKVWEEWYYSTFD